VIAFGKAALCNTDCTSASAAVAAPAEQKFLQPYADWAASATYKPFRLQVHLAFRMSDEQYTLHKARFNGKHPVCL
jgi:hypothetical protein